ncbi:MAG TPA: acyl-CoA dehydrogenase family protein, partial [Burkholderiales bacterium]|nr:acyl-CoA dehydrogenase family protein [Burkholderiales bacterium]
MKKPVTSFADVGYDEAMRRARELIPFFRENAAACEKARRLTPAVIDALNRNGLLRYLQPKAWGGMELPFIAYYDMPEMLSRGDISVGWTVHNLASHHRTVGWYEMKAQEEVWGPNPDVCVASGIAFAQGRGVPVEGGVRLSGEWNFSSGTDHSEWNLLACVLREGDKPVDYLFCLVPLADYEVVDDWHVMGMRSTSSKTVRCKDVFVPSYRTISMQVAKPGHTWPGLKHNPNPHHRIPISALGGHGIGGCLVGNARAALETTIELVKSRSTAYTGARMRDFQTVQMRIATAAAKLDGARTWLRQDCIDG